MKLLVTGGAGFIGSNFIRYILKHYPEDSVLNFDKLTYAGNLENLKEFEGDERYSFIKGDVCDSQMFVKAAQGVDAVVHFAAESHVDRSIHSGHEFIRTNVFGTQVVIDAVRELASASPPPPRPLLNKGGGSGEASPSLNTGGEIGDSTGGGVRMILVSTDEVYGDVEKPRKSKDGDAFKPSSPYSASKASAECLAIAAIRTH